MQQTSIPNITSQTTTSISLVELKHNTESPSLFGGQFRQNSSNTTQIDEETKYSPFENSDNYPSLPDNQVKRLQKQY